MQPLPHPDLDAKRGDSLRVPRGWPLLPLIAGLLAAGIFLAQRWTSDAPLPPDQMNWLDRLELWQGLLLFALGGALLGLAGARIAGRADSRIRSARDIERVLGVGPVAELPDFDQVSGEVAEEFLLRLTGAIEHARLAEGLGNCLFMGVGSGAGASTLAARVSAMLTGMEREPLLFDAARAPLPASILKQGPERSGLSRTSTALRAEDLLRRLAEESREERRLVVIDAAPICAAAETELLARFSDAVFVVVECDVTSRQQLRATSEKLRRMKVRAAGFVLNRIRLEQADAGFRHSVRSTTARLHEQRRTAGQHRPAPRPAPASVFIPAASSRASSSRRAAATAEAYAEAVSRLVPEPADAPDFGASSATPSFASAPPAPRREEWTVSKEMEATPQESALNGWRERSFQEGLRILHQRAQGRPEKRTSLLREAGGEAAGTASGWAASMGQGRVVRAEAAAPGSRPLPAFPEIQPPPPGRSGVQRMQLPAIARDPGQPFDDVTILPPRHGQYRR